MRIAGITGAVRGRHRTRTTVRDTATVRHPDLVKRGWDDPAGTDCGVPKVVLADRRGCLKGAVVANVVVPTPDYVRFAAHYRFRPDFCGAAGPESKGVVENLVGYAKSDLMVPLELTDDPWKGPGSDLARVNAAAAVWCAEVYAATDSEICAVPDARLSRQRPLLGPGLPKLS